VADFNSESRNEDNCFVTQYKVKDTLGISPTVIQPGSVFFLLARSLQELNFSSQTATPEHDQNDRLQSLPRL